MMVGFFKRSKTIKDGIELHDKGASSISAMPVRSLNKYSQPVNEKLDARFFTKLPLEVRILIYRQILASWGWTTDAIHVVATSQVNTPPTAPWEQQGVGVGNLTWTPCASTLGDPFLMTGTHFGAWPKGHLACCGIANWRREIPQTMEADHVVQESGVVKAEMGEASKVNILLACQRIYKEMSSLLYSSLEFNFLDIRTAVRFLSTIHPQNRATIRSVSVIWRVSFSDYVRPHGTASEQEDWANLCDFLKGMPAITKLHIAIYDCQYSDKVKEDLNALLPISVHGGSFTVELPSLQDWHAEDASGGRLWESTLVAPFVIERRPTAADWNVNIGAPIINGRGGSPSCFVHILLGPFYAMLCLYMVLEFLGKCLVNQLRKLWRKVR